jgi:serine/threonine protein kinase
LIGTAVAGRYQVLEKLGTGSLGAVYVCADLTTTQRVALKVFRREFAADDDFMRRLRRQARLAVTLSENQPSILAVYDCDRMADGRAFIITEYLPGRTLQDVIQCEGPLDVERALRVACQIAEGLYAIHNAGYVHGDVRTENVILVEDGTNETAKLKGFEVAALRDTPPVARLIQAEAISSNAEYIAPEQVEGDRVTVRTDIYAFGIVLYEMLTGRVPFSGPMADSIMAKQLQDLPAPLGTFRSDVPSALESRVAQALEKEPERRPRYVGDVANEDLCELVASEEQARLASERRGVMGRVATALRARRAAREEASEYARPTYWWKIGFVAAGVIVVAMLAVWMRSSPRPPARVEAPAASKRMGAPVAVDRTRPARPEDNAVKSSQSRVAPADVPSEREKGAAAPPATTDATVSPPSPAAPPREVVLAPVAPAPPPESSLLPPRPRGSVPTRPRPMDRIEPPPPEPRRAVAEPMTQPPRALPEPPPRSPAVPTPAPSAPTRGVHEPAAIIDWLLGQPPKD